MELGDLAKAAASQHAAERQSEELGQAFPRWCVSLSRVMTAIASGRLADAEQGADEVVALGRAAIPAEVDATATALLAGIRYEQGRLGELVGLLRDTADRLSTVPFFRAMLALAYCELDQPTAARAALAPLLEQGDVGDLVFDYFAVPTAAVLATLCAELAYTPEASALVAVIAPYGNQIASNPMLWLGSFSHHLGLLAFTVGDFDEADSRFACAATAHDDLGAPVWLARTRLEWARMLLTRGRPGDAERARELLGEALDTARGLGLTNVERRAVRLLTSS
jgi:hypothetical protein